MTGNSETIWFKVTLATHFVFVSLITMISIMAQYVEIVGIIGGCLRIRELMV